MAAKTKMVEEEKEGNPNNTGDGIDIKDKFKKELEDAYALGLTDTADFIFSSSGNKRALGVLADFFYDEHTAREYERGIIINSGSPRLVGKTIVFSRNTVNHLLTTNCEISGMGLYRLSYAVTSTGQPHYQEIERLMSNSSITTDMSLYNLLKKQKMWRYIIADLEKNNNREEMLLGR